VDVEFVDRLNGSLRSIETVSIEERLHRHVPTIDGW
jgi:hypothetical protein